MKFFKHYGFLLFAVLSLQLVNAQNDQLKKKCATATPSQQWEMEFQKLVTQFTANKKVNKTQQTYVIPVIFHVIHDGQPVGTFPNLAQWELNAQIVGLNNDFAGTGYNSSTYPATAFAAWASTAVVSPASLDASGRIAIADCGVQFCLATKDTNGNVLPEPGIDRLDYTAMNWPDPAGPAMNYNAFANLMDNTIKPQTIWDVTKYLNIWVTPMNLNATNGIAGYAYFPYLSTLNGISPGSIGSSTTDGIVCYAGFVGPYGRLATHEVGHWLGLRHIWGDGPCGNDYCNDTPPAPSENYGSPVYPSFVNACAGAGNGVMFMNFMDYTDPWEQYMFTTDQAYRIQTTMANSPYRKYLGTHNLCSVQNVAPVSEFFSLNTICTGKVLSLYNDSYGWPSPSYTWSSSGGTFSPGPQAVSPSMQFSAPGIYTVTLAASNGTVSVFTKTINVTSPTLYFSSTSQTICAGAVASFTVDGVNTYTWQPGNVMNSIVSFTPAASQTYTCHGLEVNDCTTSGVVEVVVSPCVGIDAYSPDPFNLLVYPNPAQEKINLKIRNSQTAKVAIEVTDAVGRTVYQENVNVIANEQLFSIDISSFDTGIYFINVQSPEGLMNSRKFVKQN